MAKTTSVGIGTGPMTSSESLNHLLNQFI